VGAPRAERADAARNRLHLLATAREMLAEHGVEKVTMDRAARMAVQLSAALEAPFLLYLSAFDLTEAALQSGERIAQGWDGLVERVCRS
jgi:hypothetical protein